MPLALILAWKQVVVSLALLRQRAVRRGVAAALAISVLATWFAPDTSPSLFDWIRILVLVSVGALGLLMVVAARDQGAQPVERQQRLVGAGVLALIAILLNATFSIGTAISFSIGFSLIAVLAAEDDRVQSLWPLRGILSVLVPFWVWTALEAWDWGLLLLIPLAALAFISDRHIRDAAAARGLDPSTSALTPLSHRGHRLGSWLGLLGSALLILIGGLVSEASNTWGALGAIGAVSCIALEAGLPGSGMAAIRRSILLCDAGLAWIALCWMVSL